MTFDSSLFITSDNSLLPANSSLNLVATLLTAYVSSNEKGTKDSNVGSVLFWIKDQDFYL